MPTETTRVLPIIGPRGETSFKVTAGVHVDFVETSRRACIDWFPRRETLSAALVLDADGNPAVSDDPDIPSTLRLMVTMEGSKIVDVSLVPLDTLDT